MKKGAAGLVLTGALASFTMGAGAKVTELTLWDWFQPRVDVYKSAIAEYEKLNPQIRIKVMLVGWPMSDKLLTSVIAGSPPDLCNFHNSWAARLFRILAPYPADMFSINKMKNEYFAFEPAFMFSGKMYFAPEGLMTSTIFYNKQFWAEAGLASAPKTWTELRLAAKKLTKKGPNGKIQLPGFNFTGDFQYIWDDFKYQQGGWLYNKEKTGVEFFSPGGLKAAQVLADIALGDRVTPLAGDSGGAFETGKAAMLYSWTWRKTDLLKFPKLKYGAFVMPTENGQDLPARARNNWECGLGVPANVKAPRKIEAFKFIRWFMNQDKYHIRLNDAIGTVPGKLSLWDNPEIQKDEVISTVSKQIPYTVFPGERPEWIDTVLGQMATSIISGKLSAEQALKKAQDDGNIEFRKYRPKWIVERQYKPGK